MRYVLLVVLLVVGCNADPTAVIRQMKNELRTELHTELNAKLETEIAAVKVQNKTFEAKVEEVTGDVANMKTTIGGGGDTITAWIYAVMPIPLSVLFYTLFFKPVLYWLGLRKREATRADLEQIQYRLEHANWSQGHFDLASTPDSKGTTQ